MRAPFFAVTVIGVLLSACVGDSSKGPNPGELDGPCLSNNTCNSGLTCGVVSGTAKCVESGDASPGNGGADGSADADSGPTVCPLTPTTFPCAGQNPPNACFGTTQSCTATGCSGQTDLEWTCFSPNQCSNTPCCVSAASATLVPGANCTQGTLLLAGLDAGAPAIASNCKQGFACPAGDIQLCQGNSQCPKGQICDPVGLSGGPQTLKNAVLGACVPE